MVTISPKRNRRRNRFLLPRAIKLKCCACGLLLLALLSAYCILVMERMDHIWLNQMQPFNFHDWSHFQADYIQRFNREPPNSLKTWLQYAKYHNCNERDLYQVIEKDVTSFRKQVNATGLFLYDDVVPSGMNQTDNFIAFRLENHQLTVVASNNIHGDFAQQSHIESNLRWILRPFVAHHPPLKAILFFDAHDHPTEKSNSASLPIFTVSKMGYITDAQHPPTDQELPQFLNKAFDQTSKSLLRKSVQSYQHHHSPHHPKFKDSYDSRALLVPYHFSLFDAAADPWAPAFATRKDAIVWRGSTTGYYWGVSPRFRLLDMYGGTEAHPIAPDVPVVADFGFVDVVQNVSEHTLRPGTRMAPRMDAAEAATYKYIFDVDGNAFTSRFPGLLRSGAVTFKSTRFREWFSERLQPFVDYIPVNYDLTDLVEKVAWVHTHPEVAERIVKHGREMSSRHIRDEDRRCYTYRLILEYQTLFINN